MWSLGPLTLRSRVILAPMAGISDRATRTLHRRLGAEIAWTEMISAEGLVRDDPKTYTCLDIVGEEAPVIVQIFGRDPEHMAEAARTCVAAGAEGVDVNMGCPVNKIVKNGCGVALMQDPGRAAAIIGAMAEAVPGAPVTAKFRAGISEDGRNAVEFAKALDAAGAAGVALHPRTRSQMFSEHSDWRLIAEVKREVGCAVIGSGDIATPADAVRMLEETGCDAVMIGRAAQGNPWLIAACDAAVAGQLPPPPPTLEEKCRTLLLHAEIAAALMGEHHAVVEMRKHTGWYLRGERGAREARAKLSQLNTLGDLRGLVLGILKAANRSCLTREQGAPDCEAV
jgi:tRNA-dihydrouridine synthase B